VSGTAPCCSMRARTSATSIAFAISCLIRKQRPTLSMLERSVKQRVSSAKITLACASPLALRIWPLAHRNLDDVAQCRRVAEHLVQDSDAFGAADIEAGNGPRVGGRIEKAFGLGTPEHDVDGSFDAGGSLGDDAKDLVRRVRELERRIGVEATARPARLAHLHYQGLEKSF